MKQNVILIDVLQSNDFEFAKALNKKTNLDFKVISWSNAGAMTSKVKTLKRYLGYFAHSINVFIHRRKYDRIVAWQQYYGIIFAFLCAIFNVKKQNQLTILTFIFKEKSGLAGRIHHWFVKKAVESKYVDKIIVYSSSEVEYYKTIFNIDDEKIEFVPLGVERVTTKLQKSKLIDFDEPFFLAVGRSNRDNEFLIDCFNENNKKLIILADHIPNVKINDNIKVFVGVGGKKYLELLNQCYAVTVAFKDENISAGQLVILTAMQFSKPVISTRSNTIGDYIEHNKNALISSKEKAEFNAYIESLFNDKELYNRLSSGSIDVYNAKFSLTALGTNVGEILNNLN